MHAVRLISAMIALCFVLLCSGCISLGAKFQPVELTDRSKALVIIYRPADMCNLTDPFYFLANKKEFASLGNNAYTSVLAMPGTYTIEVRNILTRLMQHMHQGSETFELEAGRTYYIKYHRICKIFAPDTNFVEEIEAQKAFEELSRMGYTKPMTEILANPVNY